MGVDSVCFEAPSFNDVMLRRTFHAFFSCLSSPGEISLHALHRPACFKPSPPPFRLDLQSLSTADLRIALEAVGVRAMSIFERSELIDAAMR